MNPRALYDSAQALGCAHCLTATGAIALGLCPPSPLVFALSGLLVPWGVCAVVLLLAQTEKTTAERELEQNLSFEWDRVEERGQQLQPVFGPGLTGLRNLGNRYSHHVLLPSHCLLASPVHAEGGPKGFQGRPIGFQVHVARAHEVHMAMILCVAFGYLSFLCQGRLLTYEAALSGFLPRVVCSCYLASVMQVLFATVPFASAYVPCGGP